MPSKLERFRLWEKSFLRHFQEFLETLSFLGKSFEILLVFSQKFFVFFDPFVLVSFFRFSLKGLPFLGNRSFGRDSSGFLSKVSRFLGIVRFGEFHLVFSPV